jgi:hypothetical protein
VRLGASGPLWKPGILRLLLAEGRDHGSVIPVTPRVLTIARNITSHMTHTRPIQLSSNNAALPAFAMSTGCGRR